ncbi:substrate-binding domain-containing protein, partial [Dysosmobacter sp.]|uniref:substrate-binding domain-containing protein n=1 Tax=Dysosmobacter sp. TaxID=2591382 RepID=UPI003AB7273A
MEMRMVGFDDSSVCPVMEPELSSIHVDCRRMGELCMEHMAALLDGAQDVPRLTVV